jgi:hypothetical protein
MTCVREAWLTMGSRQVALEDRRAGYFCASLDLGFPTVREVVTNVPDGDGVDDRTQFFGGRVVSADIVALTGAGSRIDAVASLFAPFMTPSQRPVLHYVLDRPGAPERIMTLRASNYSWPIVGDQRRDIHLQWLAPDPVIYSADEDNSQAFSGSSVQPGRRYDLTFDRSYPPGGSFQQPGFINSMGEIGIRPRLRLFGPINEPKIVFAIIAPNQGNRVASIPFRSTFRVDVTEYVDIDTVARTAYLNGDKGRPVLRFMDWTNLEWPYIPPTPARAVMTLEGRSTTEQTNVVALWRDSYLT